MKLTDREYRLLGKQFAKEQHEQALRFIEEIRTQESIDLPERELYEIELLIFEEGNRSFPFIQVFILASILLFDPASFTFGHARYGFRDILSQYLGKSCCTISRNLAQAKFYYRTYKQFRDTVDRVVKRYRETRDYAL